MRHLLALACIAGLTAGCDTASDDGVVDIAYIGTNASLFSADPELSPGAQLMRSAQRQGLVRFNARGEVVPGIAERWIVTDDGRSYIFRISEFDLPGGDRLTAQAVAAELSQTLARLEGTSLGLDLAKVIDVRAMTGRVIEIRLRSPMPGFLQLMAQPELGVALREGSAGPMDASVEEGVATLVAIPPDLRGLSEQPDWEELVNPVKIGAYSPQAAVEAFAQGQVDLLLGGRMETLPLAITGALSRGTVRLDSPIGLFGLDVVKPEGFLAAAQNREALSMAINRDTLLERLNIGGWSGSTRIVSPGLPGDDRSVQERWAGQTIEQRRATASARVRSWQQVNGAAPSVSIFLPQGPGSRFLFETLTRDLAEVGIAAARAESADNADLVLRDRVARYAGPRWYLNQFNCALSAPVCNEDADFLVQLTLDAANGEEEASYLAEAEQTLAATYLYIPFGSPIRWAQVRAGVDGFSENAWAFHPLFPMSRAPI